MSGIVPFFEQNIQGLFKDFQGNISYFARTPFTLGFLCAFPPPAFFSPFVKHHIYDVSNISLMILALFKVTQPSFFGGLPSYFEALWYPHLYFYQKSNT